MLRTCPLQGPIKWFRRGDDLLPIVDRELLDYYHIGAVSGQCVVGKTLALWKGDINPDFIALVASIQPEVRHGTGPASVAYCDGKKVLLLWGSCRNTRYCGAAREVGSSYFEIQSLALALDSREEIIALRDAPRPPKNPGFIYVLRGDRDPFVYKIGRSRALPTRMRALKLVTPFTVELIHTIKTDYAKEAEADIHESYKEYRVNGEWFKLPPLLVRLLCEQKRWAFWPECEEEEEAETLL